VGEKVEDLNIALMIVKIHIHPMNKSNKKSNLRKTISKYLKKFKDLYHATIELMQTEIV
jgi:hypothetical protein